MPEGGQPETGPLLLRTWGTPLEVEHPADLVNWYLGTPDKVNVKYGPTYYRTSSTTDTDTVTLADLGFAVLFAGRPSARAAKSLARTAVDVSAVPHEPLHDLTVEEHKSVVDGIMGLVALDGFGSAVATKVLHKKRPASVPVLDNMAIFGTYLDENWQPGRSDWPRRSITVRDRARIADAVEKVARDLAAERNKGAWEQLESTFDGFTRVELFDIVWWAAARRRKPAD